MRQLTGLVWALIALSLLAIGNARAAEEAEVREAERRALEAEAGVHGLQQETREREIEEMARAMAREEAELARENAERERELRIQRVALEREAEEMARASAREEDELAREEEELAREAELEARLDEAQERLEEAARQVAELSSELAGDAMVLALEGLQSIAPRPMLGINISTTLEQENGLLVSGVTPGGPADEAGVKVGDVLIRVDDVDLTSDKSVEAGIRLTDYMGEVEDGDEVTITFLRQGDQQQVVVLPRRMNPLQLAFSMGENYDFDFGDMGIPEDLETGVFQLRLGDAGPWADMELVNLSPDLASYFGTDEGLLVIRAPEHVALKLKDGDVILEIDGRQPTSPSHAMRILRSYDAGETVGLRILRDKRRMNLELQMPAESLSHTDHDPARLSPSAAGQRVIRLEPETT